ncbi:hypothetical protein CEXT_814841 [Caerostris extrusa]|uniref:Uncharacterized protein n=1 Tax=Caerostris extrusa TaxID=172846 RepID=A0AAV4VKV0_CAEEX|nr:hypothetical protein CEXT_814841 [Caerostris extrusa]
MRPWDLSVLIGRVHLLKRQSENFSEFGTHEWAFRRTMRGCKVCKCGSGTNPPSASVVVTTIRYERIDDDLGKVANRLFGCRGVTSLSELWKDAIVVGVENQCMKVDVERDNIAKKL